MIYACDFSNWQGADIRPLIDQHKPTHVIIRASTETEALRQIAIGQCQQVIEKGCTLDIYGWQYPWLDPAQSVQGWLSVPRDAATPFGRVWIDVEETQTRMQFHTSRSPSVATRLAIPAMGDRLRALHAKRLLKSTHPTVRIAATQTRKLQSQIEPWLDGAFGELDRLAMPAGIYTGQWYWVGYVGNSQRFAERPLLYANYDQNPDLGTWPNQRFGGWQMAAGKQWSSDPIDRDVLADWVVAQAQQPTPTPDNKLAQLQFMAKHVLTVNEQQLNQQADALISKAGELRAMATELRRIHDQYEWALE